MRKPLCYPLALLLLYSCEENDLNTYREQAQPVQKLDTHAERADTKAIIKSDQEIWLKDRSPAIFLLDKAIYSRQYVFKDHIKINNKFSLKK